jgi:AhpD family alkylhydroperoxidase
MTSLSLSAETADERRRAAVRVPLTIPKGMIGRLLVWYSRRTYGDVLDNGLALLHNRPVLFATAAFERKVDKWNALDPDLKTLAVMASSSAIGCSWCIDFGYYAAHSKGQSVEKLGEVPRWRDSAVFTHTERLVLEYAEAMTATPPTVTDELVDSLKGALGVAAVVELTMMVAVENERSRFNSALGLTSQGFSDRCELPR